DRARQQLAQLLPARILVAEHRERDVVAERLAHLALAVEPEQLGQRRQERLALGEQLAPAMIEAARDAARELDVLHLILPDGNEVALVEQDVGGLQHGILEQTDVDVLRLRLGLVLELRHALEVSETSAAV